MSLFSQFSADAIQELFDIRKLIEQSCVERLDELSDEKLQEIVVIITQMDALSDGGKFRDYARFIELDSHFHAFLVTLRGNKRLIELYEELQWPLQVVRGLSHANYHRAEETLAEHRAIVRALMIAISPRHRRRLQFTFHNAKEDLLRHVPVNIRDDRRAF